MSAVESARDTFTAFMITGPPPPWIFLPLMFVTWPLLTLIHELGHAAVALALRPGRRVWVVVGRHPQLERNPHPTKWIVLGPLEIAFGPMSAVRQLTGVCVWEPAAGRTELAVIAFAGPAATLISCLVIWNGLVRVDPGLLYTVLWVLTFCSLVIAAVNLVPFSSTDSGGTRRPSDGGLILDALLGRGNTATRTARDV